MRGDIQLTTRIRLGITPWDPAGYMTTELQRFLCLKAALEERFPKMLPKVREDIARSRILHGPRRKKVR
jgi:hypothetical protein